MEKIHKYLKCITYSNLYFQAFVSCELGPNSVAGAMIGMGVMQLIAACTLSMLLRHTKRVVVISRTYTLFLY